MDTVYIETSVVSYVVARPSIHPATLSRQRMAKIWWEHRKPWSACYISELVLEEAGDGDPEMARLRIDALVGIERLQVTPEVGEVAAMFLATGAMPAIAADDATHLAVATVWGVDFLVTYDNRHLANAQILRRLEKEARHHGLVLPSVCNPEQLIG